MYFTSQLHEERFKEAVQTYEYQMGIDAKALVYLATSDILREAKLVKVERGSINASTVDASKLSSSQRRLAELALNLYNSANECETSIATIIDCLDSDNRKLLIQALIIRANISA